MGLGPNEIGEESGSQDAHRPAELRESAEQIAAVPHIVDQPPPPAELVSDADAVATSVADESREGVEGISVLLDEAGGASATEKSKLPRPPLARSGRTFIQKLSNRLSGTWWSHAVKNRCRTLRHRRANRRRPRRA